MKYRVSNRLWIASLGGLLFCACSDGGDGDGASSPPPEALVNESTAESIASVVNTLNVLASTPDLFMLATSSLPSANETEFCPGGGAVDYGFEIDELPFGEISDGDRVVVDYDFCRNEGVHIDGTLGYDFTQVTGSVTEGEAYELDLDLGLDSLVLEVPEVRVRVNGLVTSSVTGDLSGSFFTQGGWSLTTHTNGNVTVDESLVEFVVTSDIDNLPGGTRVRSSTLDAVLESEVLPGELLTVETIVPFVSFDGQNPYVGELKIIAGDDSSVRVVVVDIEVLELYIDKNGDGIADEIIEVPWATM